MLDLHTIGDRPCSAPVAATPRPPEHPPNVEVVLPTPPAQMSTFAALIAHPVTMQSVLGAVRPAGVPAPPPSTYTELPREVPPLPLQPHDKFAAT